MGVSVTMTAIIADKQGKLIFSKTYFAQSADFTAVAGGVYDPQKLMGLFYFKDWKQRTNHDILFRCL